MSSKIRIAINVALFVAIIVIVIVKLTAKHPVENAPNTAGSDANIAASAQIGPAIPTLLELGSHKCVPCKAMVPVLDELRKDFDGKLKVEFIDIYEYPAKAERYNVSAIPLQIFFDAQGKELGRHEGFFARDDIVAQFKELGVDLAK